MTTVTVLNERAIPDLFITLPALGKVHEIVRQSPKEVGWMGQMVREVDDKGLISLTLFNPYCPRQEVSGATTDIDAEGVAEYALAVKQPELIKWWGHSHVKMGVSPSGTDMTTFHEHIEHDPDVPFVMSIHNQMHETYCNIYIGGGVYAENVPLHIDWDNGDTVKEVAEELKLNVREKVYAIPKSPQTNGYNSGKPSGKGKGKRNRSGGNRKQSSVPTQQERNVIDNAVGFGFY